MTLFSISFTCRGQTSFIWNGSTDTNFFNPLNWNDTPTADVLKATGNNYQILYTGTNNFPVYNENVFRTTNANLITSELNSLITINAYTMHVNKSEINGNLNINGGGINIRNSSSVIIYNFSQGVCTINITNGGSLNARNQMHVGSGSGNVTANLINGTISNENSVLSIAYASTSSALINVKQAGLIKSPSLRIGANGTIHLTETGAITTDALNLAGKISLAGLSNITIKGNVIPTIQAHIDAGRIYSSEGKNVSVVYDTESDKTVVTSGNTMQWISKQGPFIVLTNGIVTAKIEETTSKLKSFSVNGTELLAQTNSSSASRVGQYHDFTFGADEAGGFEVISGTTFSIKESNDDYIDVSFKKTYSGTGIPLDVDIHYVLKKGESGIYTYNILEHKPNYPGVNIGSWRQVFWIANDGAKYTTEKIFVNEKKKWEMPSLTDTWEPTGIAEIVKMTSGAKAGKYDGKYEYVENLVDIPVYGFASDINKVGLWAITPNYESFNGGPTHQDLNAAAGIIHICMNGIHYGESGYNVAEDEIWSKIYGPYMLYASTKETAEENWLDAKAKASYEKTQWPYSWLTNTPSYPLAHERGNINGTLKIEDSFKPQVSGKNAWIGLVQLSEENTHGWEMESKNYQYWVKTDESGNFNISARPGTYTLYAFTEGIAEEFKLTNISVTAGNTTDLGNIQWSLNRSKKLLWEIGIPNRGTSEFKMGDLEYSEGFTHEKFRGYFNQVIEYNVSEENWSEKIPYVHARYPMDNTYTNFEPWTWHLNFELPATFNPNSGANIDLNVAFSSNAKAQYWIYVNNREKSGRANFEGYPEAVESNSYIRQANHGKYSYKTFSVARNKLKPGSNTITFVMPSSNGNVSHVMYDYISLAGDDTMVLPVTLTSFKANKNGNAVNLTWNTSHEEHANKYIVERAPKDGVFTKIGELTAKNRAYTYHFIDDSPLTGINYYQIIQVDANGLSNTYGPTSLYFGYDKNAFFTVYAESSNSIAVNINKNVTGSKEIKLLDITGKIVINKSTSENNLVINSKNLIPGIYTVNISSSHQKESKKIVIH